MKLNEWADKYTLSFKKLTTRKEEYLAKFINHALQGGKFYWSIVVDHGNGEASTGRGSLEECFTKGVMALDQWFETYSKDPSDYLFISPIYKGEGAGTGFAIYHDKTIEPYKLMRR